jgi:hypothetical protein
MGREAIFVFRTFRYAVGDDTEEYNTADESAGPTDMAYPTGEPIMQTRKIKWFVAQDLNDDGTEGDLYKFKINQADAVNIAVALLNELDPEHRAEASRRMVGIDVVPASSLKRLH